METIKKIRFIVGSVEYGYIHLNENNEITLFTDDQGNVLDTYESWTVVEE